MGAGAVFIPFQAAMQKRTPVEMTGRVFGTVSSLTTLSSLAGPLVGGIVVTWFGVASTYVASGGLLIFIGLLAIVMSNRMERGDALVTKSNESPQGAKTT
jgi:MFS family permease